MPLYKRNGPSSLDPTASSSFSSSSGAPTSSAASGEDWNFLKIIGGIIQGSLPSKDEDEKSDGQRSPRIEKWARSSSMPSTPKNRKAKNGEHAKHRGTGSSKSKSPRTRSKTIDNSLRRSRLHFDTTAPNPDGNTINHRRKSFIRQDAENQGEAPIKITMGLSNLSFKTDAAFLKPVCGQDKVIRGPFVRAPTDDHLCASPSSTIVPSLFSRCESDFSRSYDSNLSPNPSPSPRSVSPVLAPLNFKRDSLSSQKSPINPDEHSFLSPHPSPCTSPFLRLSSCRPSISSCSSSLFSFSSSKEASPAETTGFQVPVSPRSPRARNPSFQSSNTSVFVYPANLSTSRREDMVGSLNPELYRGISVDCDGEQKMAKFKVKYLAQKEFLEISILKLKHFPQEYDDIGLSLTLLPDERSLINGTYTQKDSHKTYLFPVSRSDLPHRTLRINFLGNRGHRKPARIGVVLKPMRHPPKDSFEVFTELVQDQSDEEEEGATPRVKISLCANPTLERLTVAVYQCDGLESWAQGLNKCYVKVCLQQNLKTIKIKKTDVIKVSSDEVAFNQSFNFKVDIESMKEMGIAIQVVEATNMLDRDKDIGFVVLGSSMLAKGSGEEHWNKAIQIPKETTVMWHNLSPDSL
ncbi:hypothetical protein TCAL_02987 [Tigriopus californicus]|uniref:C2 domain-containing protein n=1 Tax=Tigriopus californicus TaxID=6832 RepID=A0A553PT57_TIGCA|nr:hypothetical protein TCAL_02987 [Tigriopus californicus]